MSLINEVLEDLDNRQPARKTRDGADGIQTAGSAVGEDSDVEGGADWPRLVAWSLVAGGVVLFALYEFVFTPPEPAVIQPASVRVTQPASVAPAPPQQLTDAEQVADSAGAAPVSSASIERQPELLPREPEIAEIERSVGASLNASGPSSLPKEPDSEASAVRNQVREVPDIPTPVVKRRRVPLPPARAAFAEAKEALQRGEVAAAEAALREVLKRAPGNIQARELLAGILLRGDRRNEAAVLLDKGLDLVPGHTPYRVMQAHLLAREGRVAESIALLEGAPKHSSQTLELLGALYQQNGNHEAAVETYTMLLRQQPQNARYQAALGMNREGVGDSAGAAVSYRRALALGGLPLAIQRYLDQRLQAINQE